MWLLPCDCVTHKLFGNHLYPEWQWLAAITPPPTSCSWQWVQIITSECLQNQGQNNIQNLHPYVCQIPRNKGKTQSQCWLVLKIRKELIASSFTLQLASDHYFHFIVACPYKSKHINHGNGEVKIGPPWQLKIVFKHTTNYYSDAVHFRSQILSSLIQMVVCTYCKCFYEHPVWK